MSSPTGEEIERRLERFFAEELLDERYDGRDPLVAGVIDSLGLEQLVDFIEQELGVVFDDEEMVVENFESLPRLVTLVEAKLRRAAL